MAITTTSDMVLISNCDDVTGWDGGAVDDAYMIEGAGCLGAKVSQAVSPLYAFTPASPLDLTNKFLMQPLLVNGAADTKANGGYRIYMETDASNYGYWYVGGIENTEKWVFFAVDPTTPYSTGLGTVDPSNITKIGVQFKTVSQASGNASNCFWDISHYGSYMQVTSLLTDNITFADIATASASNYWGFAQNNTILGVVDIQGLIKVGSTISGDINFNSVGELAIWRDNEFLPDAKSGLELLGNSSTTTNVNIQNGVLKGQITSPYFDATDANLSVVTVSSNPFLNFASISLESSASMKGCTLDSCGLVTPLTAVFEDNTISNSLETSSYALDMPQTNNIARITYTGNYWGFGVSPATDGAAYIEDGGVFSGNIADVYNTHATNAVTINVSNGSNIATSATAGGVVSIVAGLVIADWTISPSITQFEYAIYTVTASGSLEGAIEVQHEESTIADNFTYTYTYSAGTTIAVQVIDHGIHDFVENITYYLLSENNQSFTILLSEDTNN